uniref:Prepilin-type N-terminal cleavage/methylation domain-containing protein n=1 Tax=uncultured Elusimicrobia bacterium TaxID=699876 RepID=A0A650EM58_9BACT|nr:hypothetical protein Elusimicrob2101_0830 [uncultured Elusimicrobia bacterium]
MKGFTLIELLVVVLIIGVLAAVALPQYSRAVDKSRAMQAIILLSSINKADQVYYMANGQYAKAMEDLDIGMPGWISRTESGGDPHYNYSWGYCSVDTRGGNTACNIRYSFGWLIIRLVPANHRLVCALEQVQSGHKQAEQLCKSLGFEKESSLYVMNL